MHRTNKRNDGLTVPVKLNDIDEAFLLLRKQAGSLTSFRQIRKPRKTERHRQRKEEKRLKAAEDKV